MSDFEPYSDDEIVIFGLIPDGPATFEVTKATRKSGAKGDFINITMKCEGGGVVNNNVFFRLHPAMRLTFKHFYKAAGIMSLFDIGALPDESACIGITGKLVLGHGPGGVKNDGTNWPDKNEVNDIFYDGYDPLRLNTPAAPKVETTPAIDAMDEDQIPF